MIVLATILVITMLVVVPLYLYQKDGKWSFGKEPCHLKRDLPTINRMFSTPIALCIWTE